MAQPNYPPGRPANPPPASGGTPKIVPVLVSMGVAVGTFCGLYFGLGTKTDEAAADPSGEVATGSGSEGSGSAAVTPDPTGSGSGSSEGSGSGSAVVAATTDDAGAGSGSAVVAATVDAGAGSGSAVAVVTVDAGAGSGSSAGGAEPALTEATVQFSVIPPTAEVMVDGKPVDGGVITVALTNGKKSVKITAKASGYRSFEKKMTIEGDQLVSFKMQRRGGGSSNSGSNSGPGEKIDLGKIDM